MEDIVAQPEILKVSIPSRRVGDLWLLPLYFSILLVSIPSRRVGDRIIITDALPIPTSFHPLKAGRRPQRGWWGASSFSRFHPLKAGRRRNNLEV